MLRKSYDPISTVSIEEKAEEMFREYEQQILNQERFEANMKEDEAFAEGQSSNV